MTRWLFALFALLLAPLPATAGPLDGWAVAVVAGDWQAHSGNPTAAFDNARRDVVWSLTRLGVPKGNIVQFSPTARLRGDPEALVADKQTVERSWYALTKRATVGCLFYVTSHGNQQGVVVGGEFLSPQELGMMLDLSCPARPTVVVISACFSGVFVPALAAPNRFIMTAARRDRSSFGCSEDATYPYFDGCILSVLPTVRDFPALAADTRSCIAAREKAEHLTPPSEPQVSMGAEVTPLLQRLALHPAAPPKSRTR